MAENVEVALLYRKRAGRASASSRVAEALERVGIAHRARHRPQQLSGGQQQRVAVARALVSDPSLILADEPTGNLDTANGEAVMELLTEAADAGVTVVMVTHSLAHAAVAAAHHQAARRPGGLRNPARRLRRPPCSATISPPRLRNLARNRLYAGVTIAGLAIGFAAAMLIGLYVRDEFTFDRFVPGHERIYLMTDDPTAGRQADRDQALADQACRATAARLPRDRTRAAGWPTPTSRRSCGGATSWRPSRGSSTPIANFFSILRLPVLAGDLDHALDAPDAMVLTAADRPKVLRPGRPRGRGPAASIGQPFRVTAVLKDLPSNTHITAEMFASAQVAPEPDLAIRRDQRAGATRRSPPMSG